MLDEELRDVLDEELDTELPTDVDELLYVRLLLPLLLLLLPEVVVERDTDEEREPLLDEPLLTRLLFIPDDVAPLPLTVVVVLPFTLEVDAGKP
jgi:hypothetical protein